MVAQSLKRQTELTVRVVPGSSTDKVVAMEGNVLRVKLKAPAVEGKANRALIAFLAKRLGIPKRKVTIVAGAFSRVKRLRIEGIPESQAYGMLSVDG